MQNNEAKEIISYYHPQDMPYLQILDAQNTSKCFKILMETYSICTVMPETSGAVHWSHRQKDYETNPYGTQIMEPGEVYASKKIMGKGYLKNVFIATPFMNRICQDLDIKEEPHFQNNAPHDMRYYQAFVRFHQAVKNESSLLERESYLFDALQMLLKTNAEERPHQWQPKKNQINLNRVRDFLVENYAQQISLPQLAKLAEMSVSHFLFLFKKKFGVTPHVFQNMVRLNRTIIFLKKGIPLKEIDVGFFDQSHLNNNFRRYTGVSLKKFIQYM